MDGIKYMSARRLVTFSAKFVQHLINVALIDTDSSTGI